MFFSGTYCRKWKVSAIAPFSQSYIHDYTWLITPVTVNTSTFGFLLINSAILGGRTEITMGDVLSFFTGADNIPPLGLGDATLTFNDTNPYPTASTCGLCFTLPTMYRNYSSFKEQFIFAILNHGGFGLY